MKQLIDRILKTDLTPNQYILLYCLMNGINYHLNFNPTPEKKALMSKGYIDEGGLTPKANIIRNEDPMDPFYHAEFNVADKQLTVFSAKLNNLYPKLLPDGRYGRSASVKLVKDRIKAFMRLYDYDADTIFQATENYIARCMNTNFKYMKPIYNFILKDGEESTLALECEIIQDERRHQVDKII